MLFEQRVNIVVDLTEQLEAIKRYPLSVAAGRYRIVGTQEIEEMASLFGTDPEVFHQFYLEELQSKQKLPLLFIKGER